MRISTLAGVLIAAPLAAMGGLAILTANRLTGRQPPDPIASPDEFSLPFENITFLSEDGIPLRGWFIPAEESRGTIIFCAGHSGSMDSDLKYAPASSDRRERIRAESRTAIDSLPFKQREVILATEFEDIPVKTLARRTGTPEGTLLARKHRGLKAIRKKLSHMIKEEYHG